VGRESLSRMTEESPTLTAFYKAWHAYQELLINAILPLTPAQLDLRPESHLRSIGETVAHIIGARSRWFAEDIGLGGQELARLAGWDRHDAPGLDSADLVRGLETTWRAMHEAISEWTPKDWGQNYAGDPGEPNPYTRRWVVWHVIEHDLHHGGEISITLGMHGLTAPAL
jgi:uncharacterized damage-inducible protein DinB